MFQIQTSKRSQEAIVERGKSLGHTEQISNAKADRLANAVSNHEGPITTENPQSLAFVYFIIDNKQVEKRSDRWSNIAGHRISKLFWPSIQSPDARVQSVQKTFLIYLTNVQLYIIIVRIIQENTTFKKNYIYSVNSVSKHQSVL